MSPRFPEGLQDFWHPGGFRTRTKDPDPHLNTQHTVCHSLQNAAAVLAASAELLSQTPSCEPELILDSNSKAPHPGSGLQPQQKLTALQDFRESSRLFALTLARSWPRRPPRMSTDRSCPKLTGRRPPERKEVWALPFYYNYVTSVEASIIGQLHWKKSSVFPALASFMSSSFDTFIRVRVLRLCRHCLGLALGRYEQLNTCIKMHLNIHVDVSTSCPESRKARSVTSV